MEKVDDIAKYFLETEDIKNNDDVFFVMTYGSRVNGTARQNSDLDMLIVIDGNQSYRVARLIDGVHLDISVATVDEVFYDIKVARANGNPYIESVLLTGEVLYDPNNLYELFLSELECENKSVRKINPVFASLACYYLEKYIASDNDDFYYFNSLEFLRQLMHVKLNASHD